MVELHSTVELSDNYIQSRYYCFYTSSSLLTISGSPKIAKFDEEKTNYLLRGELIEFLVLVKQLRTNREMATFVIYRKISNLFVFLYYSHEQLLKRWVQVLPRPKVS